MDSLYLVMPAYNEEANIEDVVRAWYPAVADKGEASRMVVADSGSTDGTRHKLEILQREFPKLEILSNTAKQHGPKVIALYRYAIDRGADYIFQTDSDGQTNPDEFAAFWKLRERYAGVFGFRKERGDGKIRAFVERVVCLLLGLYFHVSVPDANAPFRLMRAEVVAKYLPRMAADYNLPNIMLTTFFSYYGERIRFRKITFKPRQAGTNSVNVRKIIGIGIRALGDFHRFKKAMLADEAPVETLEAWDPDAEAKLPEDIPDMPKTVYVMNPAESVTASPETQPQAVPEAQAVAETQAAEAETTSVKLEKPEAVAPETPERVAETQPAAEAESVPDAQPAAEAEAVAEAESVADAAPEAVPEAQAAEAESVAETQPAAEAVPETQAAVEPVTLEKPDAVAEAETVTDAAPEAVPETQAAEAETTSVKLEKPEAVAPETPERVAETQPAAEAVPEADAAEAETTPVKLEKPEAAAPETPEVTTEGAQARQKPKESARKRPAKKNGRHAARKVSIKPRNGKES